MKSHFLFSLCLLLTATLVLVQVAAAQTTITVGQGGGYDQSTIQAGIDAATTGDMVLVYPGTYVENIKFNGKNIVLRSTNPASPAVVASTIIDGNQAGSVVTFAGSEGPMCVLSGFTIQNGLTVSYGTGGISGVGTHATIEYNQITNNRAEIPDWSLYGASIAGGGMSYCDGAIRCNVITSNIAKGGLVYQIINDRPVFSYQPGEGGGLYKCGGTIQNNTITANIASGDGGGLYACHGTIQNNTITGNRAVPLHGGGLGECDGTIQNNTITNNSASYGGGLYRCRGTIQNNTISGNSASDHGGGLYGCDGAIRNCIIWGNSAPTGPQLVFGSTPFYSCIQDWTGGGEGNISADPLFTTGPLGPYYLSQTAAGQSAQSPCVDAGSGTAHELGLADRTTRTDSVPDSGIVDMGYHYPMVPDLSGTLLQVQPRPIICRKPVFFSGSVENKAIAACDHPVWVEFWAINRQSGWTGYLCDSVLVGPLAAGESFDLADITPPRTTYDNIAFGHYTVEMRIDATNAVVESDETNNTAPLEGAVILPDQPNLKVAAFDFSPQDVSPDGGTLMTFSGMVGNTGTQPTTGSFWIEFRAWPDPPFQPPGPYLCDSYLVTQTLSLGETIDLSAIPARAAYVMSYLRASTTSALAWTRPTKSPNSVKTTM